MHEYYLTEGKGETVFDSPTQQLRLDFLLKQFLKAVPDIGNDILFVFPKQVESIYKGYHLRVIRTYSGFKLFVGCRKIILSDGSAAFEPIISLPDDLEIIITLQQRTSLDRFSQRSLLKPFRGGWYFSNDTVTANRTFPFLSAPVAARDNSIVYDQGDIADTGGGAISVFLNNGAIDPWKPISGSGYSSSEDQLLVPYQFTYRFTQADQMLDALFILKDSNGIEVKRKVQSATAPFTAVFLNFTPDINSFLRTTPEFRVTPESIYTLEVSGTNGYLKVFRLLFSETLFRSGQNIGLVNIQPRVANVDYHLIHPDGHLPLTDGVGNPVIPVYEIWMKSKTVFLKYRHNGQKKLKLSTETTGLLNDVDGVLISENPVSLSFQPVSYQKQDASFQLIPNPTAENSAQVDNNKLLVQLMVPDSKIFPLQ